MNIEGRSALSNATDDVENTTCATETGVMAQEVLTTADGKYQRAVILDEDGYYSVDYELLGLEL